MHPQSTEELIEALTKDINDVRALKHKQEEEFYTKILDFIAPEGTGCRESAAAASTGSCECQQQQAMVDVMRRFLEEMEMHLNCPISQFVMEDPCVLIESGKSYERRDIQAWLENNPSDPLTRKTFELEKGPLAWGTRQPGIRPPTARLPWAWSPEVYVAEMETS
jgi:hypothetical protein